MNLTRTSAGPAAGLRRPGWLLTLSPIGFVAVTVAGIATFVASGIDDTADMTPAQLDSIRVGWIVFWPVYAAAVAFGSAGMVLLNRILRTGAAAGPDGPGRGLATASQVVVGLSVASILATLVVQYAMLGFSEERLGLHSLHDASQMTSMLAIWLGAVAVVLTGLALYRSALLRRTGLVVAIIAALFVLVELALTQGGIPPFAVSFFWLAIGIGLLRHAKNPAGAAGDDVPSHP